MTRLSGKYLPPVRRPLKIYAYDPMLGRMPLHRISVDVLNEPVLPGPRGSRVEVIDYDGVADCYYEPVDLDDPAVLMQGGLDPSESDPRFHQQMVYAVAMKTIENVELALGRRFHFRAKKPLKIFPHAFRGANAFYEPRRHALLFGYFPADEQRPGSNAPGQTVFACLSHDIIVHEMTHAVTFRLRRRFFAPTNVDVLAFHEGFSDVVAIFQHFGFPAILRDAIQRTRGDLRENKPLVELATQFGHATGSGNALRSAIDVPDPSRLRTATESHERGAILVAAVFDAFFRTYQERVQDLLRIATGGTGRLPEGDIHPDLVNRIAREATSTAQATLRMCIRAFDYLPPIDITFGDYLRAMITADYELNPVDEGGLRRQMVEAFRIRGIYPTGVNSLSEESLKWARFDGPLCNTDNGLDDLLGVLRQGFLAEAAATSRNSGHDPIRGDLGEPSDGKGESNDPVYRAVTQWANKRRKDLLLLPDLPLAITGLHFASRVGQDGQPLVETIVQFEQKEKTPVADFGGVACWGGTTVVLKANGAIQYVIAKPLKHKDLPPDQRELAELRFQRQRECVAEFDARDVFQIWQDEASLKERVTKRMTLAAMHQGAIR